MLSAIIACLLFLLIALLTFLSQQASTQSKAVSDAAASLLSCILSPNGKSPLGVTWWGLTARDIAHMVEFAAIGLLAFFLLYTRGASTRKSALVSFLACLALSVADEVHKHFVPSRHFDAVDLALDAVGYVTGIALATLILLVATRLGDRSRERVTA